MCGRLLFALAGTLMVLLGSARADASYRMVLLTENYQRIAHGLALSWVVIRRLLLGAECTSHNHNNKRADDLC